MSIRDYKNSVQMVSQMVLRSVDGEDLSPAIATKSHFRFYPPISYPNWVKFIKVKCIGFLCARATINDAVEVRMEWAGDGTGQSWDSNGQGGHTIGEMYTGAVGADPSNNFSNMVPFEFIIPNPSNKKCEIFIVDALGGVDLLNWASDWSCYFELLPMVDSETDGIHGPSVGQW